MLAEVNVFAAQGKYTDDKVLMVMKVTEDGEMQTGRIQLNRHGAPERRENPR